MYRDDLEMIVTSLLDGESEVIETDERTWVHGAVRQRDRLVAVAGYCADHQGGDFIEIGCLHGGTTSRLAPVAVKHGRRIVCVDPWPQKCPLTGTDYGEDPFATFCGRMQEWSETWQEAVDIIRASSLEADTIAQIASRELVFAFVDGLHSYEAAVSDIAAVGHCNMVIAVDDVLWSEDVMRAAQEGAAKLGREWFHNPLCREGYILPSE
jgi:predicted O-methyltransferase YrrM